MTDLPPQDWNQQPDESAAAWLDRLDTVAKDDLDADQLRLLQFLRGRARYLAGKLTEDRGEGQ